MPMKEKLAPPDLKRCQAEKPNGHTIFTLGGVPGLVQCKNVPLFIAKEPQRADGRKQGSMSVCLECRTICEKQVPGTTFKKIDRKPLTPLEKEMGAALEAAWEWLGSKGSDRPATVDKKIMDALDAFKKADAAS